MQYNYTREHQLPVVVELTYEDLQIIRKLTKFIMGLEQRPEDVYLGDIRKLHREAGEAIDKVADAASYAFPKVTE